MKKLLLNLSFIASVGCAAQNIPTPGFETWVNNTETGTTYQVPQSWVATDMITRAFNSNYTGSAVIKTTQSHTGSAAALCQTVIMGGDTANGVLISTPSFAQLMNGLFNGAGLGFASTTRPANLTGFYKLTSISGDYGVASVALTKWNTSQNKRDTIAIGTSTISATASSYTSFSVPLSYTLNAFPDSAVIVIGLDALNRTHVGSQFFIDDLAFSGSVPFSVQQFATGSNSVSVYPNPFSVSSTISIDASVTLSKGEIFITDVLGKEVERISTIGHETLIRGEDLVPGVYFYQVNNAGAVLSTGKFVIE